MSALRQASFLLILSLSFVLIGCVEPVKLAVTPVAPTVAPQIDRPCPQVDCLATGQPQSRITLGGDEEFLWARISPDGKTLVGAIAPKAAAGSRSAQVPISIAAFDTEGSRELWRVQLASKRVDAEDVFFAGADKVVLLTDSGLTWRNTLMALDRTSGREVWRLPREGDKPFEPAHMVIYDPNENLFIAGSTTMRIVDANTGQVITSRSTQHPGLNPRVTGGLPFWQEDALFLYDNGLIRVSRNERQFVWGRKFATFAEDDYTGANVGLAVMGALLGGGGGGSIPPDYVVGRTTEPVLAGDRLIVGALGRVYAVQASSGELVWAQDLAVPHVARVAVRGDRVYALAGGNHIFWHGRQGMSVREPVRYGLYALSLSDGKPVAAFRSPFNANVSRTLATVDVEKFDEDDAFEEEEDWADSKPAAGTPQAAGGGYSTSRLVDLELLDNGLLVLTSDAVVVLDGNGGEVRRHPLGELGIGVTLEPAGSAIVARTKNGAAAFSSSGTMLWQRKVDAPLSLEVFAGGYVPLVRTTPWRQFREIETKHFGGQLWWLSPGRQTVIVPTMDSRLLGLRASSGETAWEVPVSSRVALENGYIVSLDRNKAEIYRIGS